MLKTWWFNFKLEIFKKSIFVVKCMIDFSFERHARLKIAICDMSKQNQSEVGNTDFKIQPNKAENVFCFLLFLASFNCSYLWNHQPISMGFSAKCSFENTYSYLGKWKLNLTDFRLRLITPHIYRKKLLWTQLFWSN